MRNKKLGKKATCRAILDDLVAKKAPGYCSPASLPVILKVLEQAFEAGYDDGYANGRKKDNAAWAAAAKEGRALGNQ